MLKRFFHLETRRPEPGAKPPSKVDSRFDRVETDSKLSQADPPQVRLTPGRFDEPVELMLGTKAEQQFLRCMVCQVDCGRFTKTCHICRRPLDTPEQLAFNERHREQQQAQKKRDEEELIARADEQATRTTEERLALEKTQREWAIELGERERRRLEDELGLFGPSLGKRLLWLIPNEEVRERVKYTAFALLAVAWLVSLGATYFSKTRLFLLVVTLVLLAPFRRR
jgi:hypothetical protein